MAQEDKKNEIEREYTIPLRSKCRHVPRYKKTNKAVRTVKEFLVRHMKIRDRDLNKIKLDIRVNDYLWENGIKNPPCRIKVKAVKKEDFVYVSLLESSKKLEDKQKRMDKREENAKKSEKAQKVEEKVSEKNNEAPESDEKKEEEKELKDTLKESERDLEKTMHKQKKHEASGVHRETTKQMKKILKQ
jgi:large subunit ribosomal protein L31e